jgi:hypothetical protein
MEAMAVDLAGQTAAVAGARGDLYTAIAALLKASGATVSTVSSAADIVSLGHLDVIVNIALDGGEPGWIESLCRTAAERMPQSSGRILNIVSAAGASPLRGEAKASADAAAILAVTRILALELGERGILVNALAVGAIDGNPLAGRLLSHVPLRRTGTVHESAYAALFLLDPENSYTTGHVMVVDGGWAAGYARNF